MKQSILRGMLGLSLILFTSATTFAQGLKVTLLGTGSPIPLVERFGPSTLVEAGTEKLLFDCGRGVPIRLWQLKVPLHEVSAVFFTHLHSDHVVGFPDLWLTGWLPPPFGQRSHAAAGLRPNWDARHDAEPSESVRGRYSHSNRG